MINPLYLRPDLAHTMSIVDNKTDEGLFLIVSKAFMEDYKTATESQLAFVMVMTLAVIPTINAYWKSDTIYRPKARNFSKYLEMLKKCWLKNKFEKESPISWLKPNGSQYQALDEAYLVLAMCDEIMHCQGLSKCFEQTIDLVIEGYAILPAVHPEETEMLRDWIFDEVIPYCAAGALPPFIYTINGIKPTAAALKQLLNHD